MANKYRLALTLLASSSLIIGLAGCGTSSNANAKPDPSGPINLKIAWWGTQDRTDRTQKVIQLFEQKYPNIQITTEYAGSKDYWTKMATEAAGGNLPDVMQMDFGYIGDYTARHLLAPLDSYVKSGALNLSDVDPAYTDGGKINGQLYGLSLGANAPAFAIDPAAFSKAGVPVPKDGYTWDDVIASAQQFKAKSGKDFYVADAQSTVESPLDIWYYLRQRGISKYNAAGNALGFTDPQVLADYFTLDKKLLDSGVIAPPTVSKGVAAESDTLFVKGNAAMHGFTSNLITAYAGYANRPLQLIAPPSISGGQEGNYLKPSQYFSIPTSSKNKDAAVKFIDFFTNDLAANEILLAERGVPVSSKVRTDIMPKVDAATQQQFTYIEYVQKHSRPIDPPFPKGDSQIADNYNRIEEALFFGQITPQEAAKQYMDQANQILSNNK